MTLFTSSTSNLLSQKYNDNHTIKFLQARFCIPLCIFLIFSTWCSSVSLCPPPSPPSPIPRSRSGSYLAATPYLIHCASQRKSFPLSGLFTLATIHAAAHSAPEYIPRAAALIVSAVVVVTILGPGGQGGATGSTKIKVSIRRCDRNSTTRVVHICTYIWENSLH